MSAAEPALRRSDVFVSIVVVLPEPSVDAVAAVRALHDELAREFANYELVLVDNASDPLVLQTARGLLSQLDCLRLLRLSRRYSGDTAIFAGVEAAIGDTIVVTDLAFDPIQDVRAVIERSFEGHDVVQGRDASGGSAGTGFTRLGRRFFYWYNRRVLGVPMDASATTLTALSRRAANSLAAASRSHRYFRHLLHHVGLPIVHHDYSPLLSRATRSFRTGLVSAIEMVTSYSTHPLRVVTVVGLLAAAANLLYAIYVLVANLVVQVAEGWTTTSLQLSLMFFVVSLILAVQSEYLGRVLQESRREPGYFLLEELESETMIADLSRRNVVD